MSHDVGTLIMFAVREALSRPDELRKVVGELIARGEVDAAMVVADDPLGLPGRRAGSAVGGRNRLPLLPP